MKHDTIESMYFWEAQEIKCNDTNEVVIGYKNYLKTNHWRNLRLRIYRKFNRRCSKCNKSIQLSESNIHHLTYEHVGNELDNELELLCIDCHKKIHNIITKHRTKKSWKDHTYKKSVFKK